MLLSVARWQPQQMRDVEHVCAILKEDRNIMCIAVAAEVEISASSVFASSLNS